MSTHKGAPRDPRTPPSVADASNPDTAVVESSTPWWNGGTPPPLPPQGDAGIRCHACEAEIVGEPAGHGLLVFPRGDGVTREEPPLCERCALAIGVTALWGFAEDDDEG